MKNNKQAFSNARVFNGTSLSTGLAVITENGIIEALVPADELPGGIAVTDCGRDFLAPAFMDIQIYGGNGRLFSHELNAQAIHATHDNCRAGGASRFYITLATNSMDVFYRGIDAVRAYWKEGGAGMPGLHLEGPYLNPAKKGAHLEKYIKRPELAEVRELLRYGRGVIKIMTIAPEQCSDEVIQLLQQEGIVVSAGHTDATYSEGLQAFEKGIPAATHLFNAMSALKHRAPGMVAAIYNHPRVMCSIVPDGIHVDFAALRISKKVMEDRLFIITDAVTGANEGDYPHVFKGDRYTLPDGTLSGSALTMMKGVENLVRHAGIPLEEALRMASLYPARLLGMAAGFGKIEPGYAAEMVRFDEAFTVKELVGY